MTATAERLNMDDVKIDPLIALKLPPGVALRRKALPFGQTAGVVHVACLDPNDLGLMQLIEKFLMATVQPELAEPTSLARALDRAYGDLPASAEARGLPRSVDVRTLGGDPAADPVGLGQEIMHAAILQQASDIHLEPTAAGLSVRFRVDGHLEVFKRIPTAVAIGMVNRLKVMAGLDIAEKRAPQDGGFKHRYARGTQAVDVRVATLPTRHGERMTLRLLAMQTETLTLERLGMKDADLEAFRRAIALPHGIVLLTGPTGSGKTTTLYAALRKLLAEEPLNVITVEDPIEYEIPGVSQVEVDSADKVSFVKALRSVLRHDPDVLMIGEIRDADTADVAIKASLTGHLVFSTLHTNSATNVVTRLTDIGVDRYLIAATLRLAVAQRLVRRLCKRCKTPRALTEPEARLFGSPASAGLEVFDAAGCLYCGGRGYTGRIGLFEVWPIDETVTRAIASGATEGELTASAIAGGCSTLKADALGKLLAGDISTRDALSAIIEW